MEKNSVTFPELLRVAANCAEFCLEDKNCTVKFDGRGVESIGDDRFIVNLAGAVLVKVFSHPTNKSIETLTGPAWQASLHAMSTGQVGRALEYAFGTSGESAPPEIVSQVTSEYRRTRGGPRFIKQSIAWVNKAANALERASEWSCSNELLDFKGGGSNVHIRAEPVSRPFLDVCQKMKELIGEANSLKTNVGWEGIDIYNVWQSLDRIQQIADELCEVSSDDVSAFHAYGTSNVLESILSSLEGMKDWKLSSENAASDRTRFMGELERLESDLNQALQGWFPMWSIGRLEAKTRKAQDTEKRAKQAQAEASGEASSEIAEAFLAQGARAKTSRYLWTVLSFSAAAGILLVAFTLMNGGNDGQVQVWSVQRLDSIITRFLSASVLGGIAYWAGRIATMRLRQEAEHLHKALIARTLKGMKEGADTDETRAQIDLVGHISLLQMGVEEKTYQTGPMAGNGGPNLNSVISKAMDSERG